MPFTEAFDMCHPDHGKSDFEASDSQVAGYFSSSKKVLSSAYTVPLRHGIPMDYDKERHRDGHLKCYTLCERQWSKEEVEKFTQMTQSGYGYRMYLDDLPSATMYGNRDHYDENIPIGFMGVSARTPAKTTEPEPTGELL